ncbi:hypothetical protein CRE_16688 [Caenorhabditis remanei]|uniref:SID1 transmembrane family member 1 n=2 Tax=Caenorhabditis remanei TaxID=31234 RepID=E3MB36_CAERE|nr:hypothetical protein CRE_16688 [Caenorhabditis remanei]
MMIFLILISVHFGGCHNFQDLSLGVVYSKLTTSGSLVTNLYRVVLDAENPPPAISLSVSCEKSLLRNPLTVTVIRGKTVHNIALPRVQSHQGKKYEYWFASDTLCDDDTSMEQLGQPIYISISSSLPTIFNLKVQAIDNFHIRNSPLSMQTSPSEPSYFIYSFPDNIDKVDVRVTSNDQICARIIARRANCPIFDGSGSLELSDRYFYQSFKKFGGFSLRKSDIGEQFHLAVTVNPDNSVCDTSKKHDNLTENSSRFKRTLISVKPVTDNSFLLAVPILVYALSVIIVLLLTFFKYKLVDCYENNEPSIFEGNESEANVIIDKTALFVKPENVVSHKEYEKQRIVKDSKYFNFLFFQIFGSILPALTTLFQNRQQPSNQMNLDRCYLNYRCAPDAFYFNSLNKLTSASSLAIVGILNLIVVFRKKIFRYQVPRFPTTHGIQQRDAPKVVCLLGLIAMGILWTITNNCPHKTTLHLYVYNLCWLVLSAIMWIYSKRHGVRRWQQFYIIAVSSAFGCITLFENVLEPSDIMKIIIKVTFSITAMGSTGFFCFKYYYEVTILRNIVSRYFQRPSGLQKHQWIYFPVFKKERVVSDNSVVYRPLKSKVAFIVLSLSYAVGCSLTMFVIPNQTVTSSCFRLGKGLVGIYLFYYTIQKIRFEWSSFSTLYKISCFLLTIFFICMECMNRYLATYRNTYAVLLTPAESRELNTECVLPGIDWKDLRHYNCAFNCFLFIVLMDYIDSNLKGVPKKNIFVF